MKKNKKGFTLIELLAVIVILAIIALIAVPIVLNIIERARKGAFTRSSENVLKASNLYYTNSLLDVNQPEDIRFECTKTKCLSSKLDEKGNQINLNVDGNIGEGYVLITNKGEVEFLLQNGSYCAVKYPSTKNITVKNEKCSNIDITNDETAPIIDKINTVVTTNTITVTVSAYDNESGISGYAFSIDGEDYTDYQTNNVYKFNNLTNDKTYKISVKVYNGTYGKENYEEAKGMSNKETEEISLKTIEEPTFEVTPDGWATEKTVTITYPLGYTNEYSIDNGTTFLPYTEAITFTENRSIIARITDGTNTITKTQMIEKIDNTVPTINLDGIPDKIITRESYNLPTSYYVNNNLSGGNAVCKVGNKVVTNTNQLGEGEYTINCTVTTGTGISQNVSKTITMLSDGIILESLLIKRSQCYSGKDDDYTVDIKGSSGQGYKLILDYPDYSFDYSSGGVGSINFYGNDGTVEKVSGLGGPSYSGTFTNSKSGYLHVEFTDGGFSVKNVSRNGNQVMIVDRTRFASIPTVTVGNNCAVDRNITCTNSSVPSNSSVSGNIGVMIPNNSCYAFSTEVSINNGEWQKVSISNYGYKIISDPGTYRIRARYNFSGDSSNPYYSNPSEEFIVTITE